MKILPILSLCAICALAGEFEIQPENNRIHFNVNADFSDKIGQITHESPINCTPKLSGAFEFVSAQEFNFYPQNGLAKGIKIKCDDMTIENEPFAITQFRAIDERSYEIIFNDLIGDIKPSFEVFQKVKMAKNAENFTLETNKNRAILRVEKPKPNLYLKIAKGAPSIYGAKLDESAQYELLGTKIEHKPSINSADFNGELMLIPMKFNNGKIGFRVLSKEYLEISKAHIVIDGVKSFGVKWANFENSYYDGKLYADGFYYGMDIYSEDFVANKDYKIALMPGFGNNEENLRQKREFNLKAPDFAPYVEFIGTKEYLPKNASIAIKSVNVGEIDAVVEKLGDQNFRYFLNFNSNINDLVLPVATKKFSLNGAKNQFKENKFEFNFSGFKDGVYKITLYYKDGANLKSVSKIFYSSDISALVTYNKFDLNLFAFRLSDAGAIGGAKVDVYSNKNELILSANTDNLGNLHATIDPQKMAKSVHIKYGNEESFVILDEKNSVNEASFSDGEKAHALVYFTSDLIRPNENIEGVIVAKNDDFKPLGELPLKIKISDSQGKIYKEFSQNTDKFGVIKLNLAMGESSGKYTLTTFFENKIIGQKDFSVESFVPNATKNEILIDKQYYKFGQNVEVKLFSNYLFGAPADNLDVTLNSNFSELKLHFADYKDFSFVNKMIYSEMVWDNEARNFKTNANGSVQTIINPAREQLATVSNALNLNLNFAIKSGNKTSNEYKNVTIYPYDTITGIKLEKVENNRAKFELLSLDPFKNERLKRPINIKIYKRSYDFYYYENSTNYEKDYELIDSFDVNANEFEYDLGEGAFLIVASDLLSGSSASSEFFAFYDDYANVGNLNAINEAKLTLNKTSFRPGETAQINLNSAIKSGKAVLNFGSKDKIYSQIIVPINDYNGRGEFEIPADFNGGYINATIFRKSNAHPEPLRTFGQIYVNKDKSLNLVKLELNVPKKAQNAQDIKIALKTEPNAQIALFVADEGALDIVKQPEIDAFSYFDMAMKNYLKSYDIFGNLSTYFNTSDTLKFGSDKAIALRAALKTGLAPSKKVNLQTFKLTEILQSNSDGVAEFNFKTPSDFNSLLRITAISLSDDRISSTNKYIKVADEIAIKSGELMYLRNGDNIELPITLINTTNQKKSIKLSENHSSNLEFNLKSGEFEIEPMASLNLIANIKAQSVGEAYFTINVNSGDEILKSEKKLNIYSPFPLSYTERLGSTKDSATLKFPSGYTKGLFAISSDFSSIFRAYSHYFYKYPYGCTEQISSQLLAISQILNTNLSADERELFINRAIAKLLSRLKSDGSFGYWSNSSYTQKQASIYAADVLLELDLTRNFLSNEQKNLIFSYLNSNDFENTQDELYAAFVLSKNGKISGAKINALYDDGGYKKDALSQILMAYLLKKGGMKEEMNAVLDTIKPAQDVFDDAFLLYVANLIGVGDRFKNIQDNLLTSLDLADSTREKAMIFRALSSDKNQLDDLKFSVKSSGKTLDFTGAIAQILPIDSDVEILANDRIYYAISSYGYETLEPKSDFAPDKSVTIKREFYYTNGKKADLNALKVGDVITSEISILANDKNREYSSFVVDEGISACFEAINPRLSKMNFTPKKSEITEFLDIRDENVLNYLQNFYSNYNPNTMENEPYKIYNNYRVILSGECVLPAAKISSLHNEKESDYVLEMPKFRVRKAE